MKRIIIILLSLTSFVLLLHANKVDPVTAQKVAGNFFRNNSSGKFRSANVFSDLKLVTGRVKSTTRSGSIDNTSGVYIFKNQTGNGFVITSSDSSMPPILGYSYENNIDPNNLPPQLMDMINRWSNDSIKTVVSAKNGIKNRSEWDNLLSDKQQPFISTRSTTIEPLVKTKWGQGLYYNDLCPTQSGTKTYAGCVAIAVAQIMKYWNFPNYGSGQLDYDNYNFDANIQANFGQTKYNWANMPENLVSPNSDVATLCYHAGAAVLTSYGSHESIASSGMISIALTNYFNYNNIKELNSYLGNILPISDYQNIIQSELVNGRPVILTGNNKSNIGHAYICDGIKDNLYHLNFGWDGYADGYYNLLDFRKFHN